MNLDCTFLVQLFFKVDGSFDESLHMLIHRIMYVEKHFTLSRNDKGPDSEFSIEPHELKNLCKETKVAFLSLGNAGYELKDAEKTGLNFRRSLYAVKDIQKGGNLLR